MANETATIKAKPLHATTATFDTILESAGEKPVLVDFFAEWCGPCKMIAPVIEEMAAEYEGKAVITKVNVDDEHDLATRFGVMSIPTLLLFKNGQQVEKQVGFVSKAKLAELLVKHL